ncbi:UDP-N-acetylmuramoyl-L-alanyl-D-glutamate--2,6-diaminopimelate ligase [candidate division TA06 bacterium]|uniref:UDP-N-acetylmuramoyl-L-alanyl-D-glutamate--2,6-diaminopimelate ligase n=1 Tax=candidate division TA06 bacterium TaxID=2250710 RepID=A0A660SII5_UNCT6|nr:MAG: UDP-N-acetylmuramoyl-L-alanyl-D-glutamate--2,6-diaminopimelate ligase [candidate division TA06 bacterium]
MCKAMILRNVLKNIYYELISGDLNIDIKGIDYDSRNKIDNYLFIAIRGSNVDGHIFIDEAISKGAKAVIVDRAIKLPDSDITIVKVNNSYKALAKIASNFYNNPIDKLNIFGITGTNGKTTVSYILKSIYNIKEEVSLIGTIKYIIGNRTISAPNTTPDALVLNKLLNETVNEGIKNVIMEVSSHSLALGRIDGFHFQTIAFTNLTLEHLDFHKSMSEYFKVKSRLFTDYNSQYKVVNIDDKYGNRLYKSIKGKKYSCSINEKADFYAENINISKNGSYFDLNLKKEKICIKSNLIGKHNVLNIVIAASIAYLNGIPKVQIAMGIKKLISIEGRTEIIRGENNIDAIIDYAHTPDALTMLLKSVKEVRMWKKIILVFGCGGDRDREKRPKMGIIACKLSDKVIITNDNPRTEDSEHIIREITQAMKCDYIIVKERAKAIKKAFEIADNGDVIIVAGKGHEDYQIVGREKLPFSDRKVILKAIK